MSRTELDEKRTFLGETFEGRTVSFFNTSINSEEELLFMDEKIQKKIEPYYSGEIEISSEEERAAIYIDDDTYAYLPRSVLFESDAYIYQYCEKNGFELSDTYAPLPFNSVSLQEALKNNIEIDDFDIVLQNSNTGEYLYFFRDTGGGTATLLYDKEQNELENNKYIYSSFSAMKNVILESIPEEERNDWNIIDSTKLKYYCEAYSLPYIPENEIIKPVNKEIHMEYTNEKKITFLDVNKIFSDMGWSVKVFQPNEERTDYVYALYKKGDNDINIELNVHCNPGVDPYSVIKGYNEAVAEYDVEHEAEHEISALQTSHIDSPFSLDEMTSFFQEAKEDMELDSVELERSINLLAGEQVSHNKIIAEIKWSEEDVIKSFTDRFDRKPTEKELEALLDKLDTGLMEERAIEEGWNVINNLISQRGKEIINEQNLHPLACTNQKDIIDFKNYCNKVWPESNIDYEDASTILEFGANYSDKPDQLALSDGHLYCHYFEGPSADPQKDYPDEFNKEIKDEEGKQFIKDVIQRMCDFNDPGDNRVLAGRFKRLELISKENSWALNKYEQIAKDFGTDYITLYTDYESEIIEGNPDINQQQLFDELAFRLIEDNYDMRGFNSDSRWDEKDKDLNSRVLENHCDILELAADKYLTGQVKLSDMQDFIDNTLRSNRLYLELEKEGYLTELKKEPELSPPRIYAFSPFGYEGSLITIETDLRRGIPATDIVGLADGAIKESRERMQAAIRNSGFEYPSERVLISLSPADIKKEGAGFDLAVALSVLSSSEIEKGNKLIPDNVLVMGELELSGNVRPVRAVRAAFETAKANGITKFIVPEQNLKEVQDIEGIEVKGVNNLTEALDVLKTSSFEISEPSKDASLSQLKNSKNVLFDDIALKDYKDTFVFDEDFKQKHTLALDAIETAVAGKHNIYLVGAPGCGKTAMLQAYLPSLTPLLTYEEMQTTARIWNLAGLGNGKKIDPRVPFRIPHQTASVEGMLGGGPSCRPGEASLANNGILLLDETPEFRSSVLQMLRIPLENGTISLSRAGRSSTFPAHFQLAAASNPCPCGNCGSTSKICLCSMKSVDQYHNKMQPLVGDRTEIKVYVEEEETPLISKDFSIEAMRGRIKKAFEIQRAHGKYNHELNVTELEERVPLTKQMQSFIDQALINVAPSKRDVLNVLKVSLTIANLDGRENVEMRDLKKAVEFEKNITSRLFDTRKYNFEEPKVENSKSKEKDIGMEGR